MSISPFASNSFLQQANLNNRHYIPGGLGQRRIDVQVVQPQPEPKQPAKHSLLKKLLLGTALLGVSTFALHKVNPELLTKVSKSIQEGAPVLATQAEHVKKYASSLSEKLKQNSLVETAIDTVKPAYEGIKSLFKKLV